MKNLISAIICSGFLWSAIAQEIDAPQNLNGTVKKGSDRVVKDSSDLHKAAGPEITGPASAKTADSLKSINSSKSNMDKETKEEAEEEAKEKAEEANENKDEDTTGNNNGVHGIKICKDTIDGSVLLSKITGIRNSIIKSISKSRIQGYGGAASVGPLIMAVRMKPVYDLTRRDPGLKAYSFINFDEGYSPLLMMGAIGYGGVGNGTRIGFGGYIGSNYIGSEEVKNDSQMVLKMSVSYGGLLLEKVKVLENWNLLWGGILGGGKIEVAKGFQSSSAFSDLEHENFADAAFMGIELHGGCTYTVFPWLHLGADVNSLFLMSIGSWGRFSNTTFATANPGLRIRIVFGNLG